LSGFAFDAKGAVQEDAKREAVTKMLERTMSVRGAGLLLVLALTGVSAPVEAQTAGCTLTQGFWKNHPGAWSVTGLVLGGVAYDQDGLITILSIPPRGDATYILAKQLIAAELNLLNGADGSSIGQVITAADSWLGLNPLGSWPTGAAREEGLQLASQLDAFNNGLSGVPHCEGELPPPEPQD
jgi:hypothetical protein